MQIVQTVTFFFIVSTFRVEMCHVFCDVFITQFQEEIDRKVRAEKMKKIQATPIYQAIVKDHGEEAFQNMDPDSGCLFLLFSDCFSAVSFARLLFKRIFCQQ